MSLRAVEYYEVHCDFLGCDTKTADLGEFASWSDAGQAATHWDDCGGTSRDGKYYCEDHSANWCRECDEEDDLEPDAVMGWLYCPKHIENPVTD